MSPEKFLAQVLDPGLKYLASLGGPKPSDEARVFLLAVAGQESGWGARYQSAPSSTPGPARGFWQFEQGGGVAGVLTHSSSDDLAATLCDSLTVVPDQAAAWRALEGNDRLAAGFARLLLLTDPYPIPTDQAEAWDCYANRLWRPGAPHPDAWPGNWQAAEEAVASANATPHPMQEAIELLQAAANEHCRKSRLLLRAARDLAGGL